MTQGNMTQGGCANPVDLPTLLDYWLSELGEIEQNRLEAHLFGCAECTARAQEFAELAMGVRAVVGSGMVSAVVSNAFVERAAAHGARVREYTVPCGGSVNCTIAPEDDLLFARLEARLENAKQVDLLLFDTYGSGFERVRDIPFNAAAGQVVVTSRTDAIRALPKQTSRMRLVAIENEVEQVIGDYTFNHTPWGAV